MSKIFENSFWSIEGQKERLTNVKDTLVAAVTGQGVQANTSSAALNNVLGAAASHPFVTAGAAATVASGAASTLWTGLSSSTKIATIVAAPIVGGAAISSSSVSNAIAGAPSSLGNFGANIGKAIDNPTKENITNIVKENPYITAITGAAAIGAVGGGIGLAANTLATAKNTAVNKATDVSKITDQYAALAAKQQAESQKELSDLQLSFSKQLAQLQFDLQSSQLKNQMGLTGALNNMPGNYGALGSQEFTATQSTPLQTQVISNPVEPVAPKPTTTTKKKTTKKKTKKKTTKKKTTKKKTTKKKTTKKKTTKKKSKKK